MKKLLAVLLLLWMAGGAAYPVWAGGTASNPKRANVQPVQGPDATGNGGFPVSVVNAAGTTLDTATARSAPASLGSHTFVADNDTYSVTLNGVDQVAISVTGSLTTGYIALGNNSTFLFVGPPALDMNQTTAGWEFWDAAHFTTPDTWIVSTSGLATLEIGSAGGYTGTVAVNVKAITNGNYTALTGYATQPSAPANNNGTFFQGLVDGYQNGIWFPMGYNGNTLNSLSIPYNYNGATWDRQRTPLVFKSASAAASGDTALWTPTTGKKFRLMRFKVEVTANSYLAARGVLTIKLRDGTTDIGLTHNVYLGQTAISADTNPQALPILESGWIDLGNGYLSSAANAPLNMNLSAAVSGGVVSVIACGTEE